MSNGLKFFSQEWCDAAREIANSNDEMYQAFHDAATFTNLMQFGGISRPELAVHIEWKEGRIVSWTPAQYDEADLWAILNAEVPTWRDCAEGRSQGSKLLMAGKIKLVKGPMTAAIQNARALDSFLHSWGQVPTDWDI